MAKKEHDDWSCLLGQRKGKLVLFYDRDDHGVFCYGKIRVR